MILPPLHPGETRVDTTASVTYSDPRVPDRFGLDGDDPHVAGISRCTRPEGRHLFDVIEHARDEYEPRDPDALERPDRGYLEQFRARLTCVVCGYVESWEGTRRLQSRERIEPDVLLAGGLQAQHTGGGSLPTYAVYDLTGAPAGIIAWARGPRGRAYFTGRLGSRHGEVGDPCAEGPTVAAVLRKLARLHAERTADDLGTVELGTVGEARS